MIDTSIIGMVDVLYKHFDENNNISLTGHLMLLVLRKVLIQLHNNNNLAFLSGDSNLSLLIELIKSSLETKNINNIENISEIMSASKLDIAKSEVSNIFAKL